MAGRKSEMTETAQSSGRLPLVSVVTFSIATFPVSSLAVALFVYLPPYLTGALNVPLATVGTVWAAVRIADLFVDPVLGHLMDRTQTPFGRYRVWLAAGTPVLMLAVFMLFMARHGVSGVYVFVWLFVMYVGISTLQLSQWSWAASLARDYHERSRVFGVLTATGVAATVAALLVPATAPSFGFDSNEGVRAVGWFIILLSPIAVAITFFTTPERINPNVGEQFKLGDYLEIITKPEVLRLFLCEVCVILGPGWMSALYLFYFRDIL